MNYFKEKLKYQSWQSNIENLNTPKIIDYIDYFVKNLFPNDVCYRRVLSNLKDLVIPVLFVREQEEMDTQQCNFLGH